MLNRSITPELKSIDSIDFVTPGKLDITSEVPLYYMQEVPNETARLDMYFDAGSIKGNKGIASFVNGLLLSGTNSKSSVQIHNEIDALGGFFESGVSSENAVITLYALRENIVPILKIMKDAIQNMAFLPSEVNELIRDRKQKFRVNMEKVSFLAQREFQQRLFGDSVYGRILEESDFESTDVDALKAFFKENYLHGLLKVVVVANLNQSELQEIAKTTKDWAISSYPTFEKHLGNKKEHFYLPKKGALQTAVRIGRILFNKKHEDYSDFLVLNTILGDYFGSRLMSNIREDKGYTYGIGSMVAELHEIGYFLIGTEVGHDVKDDALNEIRLEIERLQHEPVPEEELALVRNYMLGQMLKSADGPYSMTDLYLSVEPYQLELEFYNKMIHSIHEITPERIQQLAIKYLNWNDLTIVSAG